MGDCSNFEEDGFTWIRSALSQTHVRTLRKLVPTFCKAGVRLDDLGVVTQILNKSQSFRDTLEVILPQASPVRGLAFNKTSDSTWSLPWHQDRVIAVQDKHDVAGFSNWTRKSGVWHCEPPINILKNMIFIQILLDDVERSNGPMEIAIGSHKNGYLAHHEIKPCVAAKDIVLVKGKAGDIFCAKALLLHRSKSITENSSRRTFRLDFSNQSLPSPLSFYH